MLRNSYYRILSIRDYLEESGKADLKKSLICVDDCVLVLIDIQSHFLAKLPKKRAQTLVDRVGWLMEVSKALNVPMIVTAEEPSRYEGFLPSLAKKLLPNTPTFDKVVFGLSFQPEILGSLKQIKRKTAVLVGLETDVCVTHSAIGLLENGFQVVVLADVTDTPGESREYGLDRMREAGVIVISLKMLYYEWIRAVSKSNEMDDDLIKRIGDPNGIVL